MVIRNLHIKNFAYICLAAYLLVFIGYDVISSYTVFPISEGWWETYSWLDDLTGDVYEKYSIQFPPLYIKLITVLRHLYDGNLLNIRLSLVGLHLLTVLVTYRWLCKFVSGNYAAIGVGVAVSLVVTNPVYLPKDYHTLVEFLVACSLLLTTCEKSAFRNTMLGCFTGLLLLTKQNIGIFFGVSLLAYLLVSDCKPEISKIRAAIFDCLTFAAGLLFVMFLYCYLFGNSWLSIFHGNDSKGGLFTVLFRFVVDAQSQKVILISIGLIAVSNFLAVFGGKDFSFGGFLFQYNDLKRFYWKLCIAVCGAVLFISSKYTVLLYSLALAWPLMRLRLICKYKDCRLPESYAYIPLLGLAYCGTQTAGYNAVSMSFLIALMFAELLCLASQAYFQNRKGFLLYLSAFTPLFVLGRGLLSDSSYDWWGLKSEPAIRATYYESRQESLKGIYLDRFMNSVLSYINNINTNLTLDDNVLATPSIPLLYILLGKTPNIAPVLWFDVTSSKEIAASKNYFNSYSPKYIFNLKTPDYVYEGHMAMRKKDPALFYIDESIKSNVMDGGYFVDFVAFPWEETANQESVLSPVRIEAFNSCKKLAKICQDPHNGCEMDASYLVGAVSCVLVAKNKFYARNLIANNKIYANYPGFVFYGLKRN